MSGSDHYPVTGRMTTQETFDRLPVEELKANQPYQWALFILGWAYIKGTPIPFPGVTDPVPNPIVSLMELGAIHGKPYREWLGDIRSPEDAKVDFSYKDKKDMYPTPSRFGGYCDHAAITFPSWHRPYVMLVEQVIGEYAENIAQQIEKFNPNEVGHWVDAAKQLRFPYWDWAEPKVSSDGVPSLFYEPELSIMVTGGKTATVPNPLVSFTFPTIPDDFEDNTRGKATAYFTQWKQTYRYAESSPTPTKSDIDALQKTMKQQADSIRRSIGHLFAFPDTGDSAKIYDEFSNTLNESLESGDQMNMGSLEGVHNLMHVNLGGNGNMAWPDYAAFDPIFFFHHANVDRLLALWDWCYPEHWMGDGYKTGKGADAKWLLNRGTYTAAYSQKIEDHGEWGALTPFRHPNGDYWTSKDARFFTQDAYPKYYSYKEFLGVKVDKAAGNLKERQEAHGKISKYYDVHPQKEASTVHTPSWAHITVPNSNELDLPVGFQPIDNFRIFKVLVRLPEHAIGNSYRFDLYYKTELVGSVAVFAREDNSPCKACVIRRENQSVVRGVITIPSYIIDEIITQHSSQRSEHTLVKTLGDIAHALSAKLVEANGHIYASAQGGDTVAAVPSNQAASSTVQPAEVALVSAAVAEHTEDKKQPVHFFDWQRHVDLFPSGWKEESQGSA